MTGVTRSTLTDSSILVGAALAAIGLSHFPLLHHEEHEAHEKMQKITSITYLPLDRQKTPSKWLVITRRRGDAEMNKSVYGAYFSAPPRKII
jgi:hypothetical protein